MVALVVEVRHDPLELRFVHLPVGHGDRQLRQQLAQRSARCSIVRTSLCT
jgi:hypothetical protein